MLIFFMRYKIEQSKDVHKTLANLDYSNTQILNKLDIPHGYPIKNHNDIGFEHLEPNDDFTAISYFIKVIAE